MNVVIVERIRYEEFKNGKLIDTRDHYIFKPHGDNADKIEKHFIQAVQDLGGEFVYGSFELKGEHYQENHGKMPLNSFSGLPTRCWCQVMTDYLLSEGFEPKEFGQNPNLHFFCKA